MDVATFQTELDRLLNAMDQDPGTADLSHAKHALYEFLDQNFDTYDSASVEERTQIRRLILSHQGREGAPVFLALSLLEYVQRAAHRLADTGDKVWLARGLAVASMEDAFLDRRDSTVSLSYLYVMAEAKRLNPEPEFRATAERSRAEVDADGRASMKDLLERIPAVAHHEYENWQKYYQEKP